MTSPVISNMNITVRGGHHTSTTGWLTGLTPEKEKVNARGQSMDQMVADAIGKDTMFPSLEFATEGVRSGIADSGYPSLYGSYISWKTPTTPNVGQRNPAVAFNRLFAGRMPTPTKEFTRVGYEKEDLSILDAVRNDAKDLYARVSDQDKQKLDEYLTSVREIERRVERETKEVVQGDNLDPAQAAEAQKIGARINGAAKRVDHTTQCQNILDIMALAFWSDTTRVSSFMFGNDVSGRNFSFLDSVTGSHHSLSHHDNKAENQRMYGRIGQWHVRPARILSQKAERVQRRQQQCSGQQRRAFRFRAWRRPTSHSQKSPNYRSGTRWQSPRRKTHRRRRRVHDKSAGRHCRESRS